MDRIDLHTHSTASDGALAPADLVAAAASAGVGVLALTDHDTTAGYEEAMRAGARYGVEIVPGVELGCGNGHEQTDILGYYFYPGDDDLQRLLTDIVTARESRAERMVERLRDLGATITSEQVAALAAGGSVGRPHVARALVDTGFVPDVPSAFREYIGPGRPAYADRYRLTPEEACRAVRAAGGVPVLAHPVPPADPWSDPKGLRSFLPPLVEAGLGGLECYYPGYSAKVVRWLEALAWHFGLVPTGGSDYHGPWREGMGIGCVDVPPDVPERLRAAARGAA
ncbi:MAG: PHP domain-containing protein [Anaerolineae bacterium]